MAGEREGRVSQSRVVMDKIREGNEFYIMMGRRRGTPRWVDDPVVAASKDDGGGGGTSDGRRRGWGGSNK